MLKVPDDEPRPPLHAAAKEGNLSELERLLKARELIEKKLFPTADVPHRVLAFASSEHKKLARFLEARGFSQRDIRVALDAVIAP